MDSGHGNENSKNACAEAESLLNMDPSGPIILLGGFENEEQSTTDSDSAFEGVTTDETEIYESPKYAASSSLESDSTAADDFQLSQMAFPNSNNSGPPTKSPPVQIMDRSEGYDPNRISSSVVLSESSTPTDWSTNSNDSLFSLQIGNSLATEQFAGAELSNFQEFITIEESQKWKELYKSGEPSRPKELQSNRVVKISDKVTVLGQTSPVAKEKPKRLDLRKNKVLITDQRNYRNINVEDKANQEGYKNKNTIRHSDGNGTNNQSSPFPIIRKPSKKACCLCSSDCSWCCCSKRPCWLCKWSCCPSFCCKWPSWSACSFMCRSPDCCFWRNAKKLFCCSSCPSCLACSLKCHSPDCCSWKNAKKICCCSSCKGLKDWRRRKWCCLWSSCCSCC